MADSAVFSAILNSRTVDTLPLAGGSSHSEGRVYQPLSGLDNATFPTEPKGEYLPPARN